MVSLDSCLAIIRQNTADQYPFFVLVHRGYDICGGTLVKTNVVITAARCIYLRERCRFARPIEIHVIHADLTSTGCKSNECYYFLENQSSSELPTLFIWGLWALGHSPVAVTSGNWSERGINPSSLSTGFR